MVECGVRHGVTYPGVTLTALCAQVQISRQAVYQGHHARQCRDLDAAAVVSLVRRERQLQPRLGGRKLLRVLGSDFQEMGIHLGRDRFLAVLRREGLLLARQPRHGPRTTDSRHWLRKYVNLLRDLRLTGPHQAWVSDITYVRTAEGWLYVFLLSDAYSRKILGYTGAETLEAHEGVRALQMAIRQLPASARPIHHSDRGYQYCSHEYIDVLAHRGLGVSMTEENHCYENAQAERLNGILKQEYGLGATFRTKRAARGALEQGVWLYNDRRPHTSLGYRMPSQVHAGTA